MKVQKIVVRRNMPLLQSPHHDSYRVTLYNPFSRDSSRYLKFNAKYYITHALLSSSTISNLFCSNGWQYKWTNKCRYLPIKPSCFFSSLCLNDINVTSIDTSKIFDNNNIHRFRRFKHYRRQFEHKLQGAPRVDVLLFKSLANAEVLP